MLQRVLKILLQAIIRLHEYDKNLIVHSMHSHDSPSPGNNFMSIATVVEIEGFTGTGEPYSRSLFIKLLPEDKIRCELFHIEQAFQNECFAYTRVFKHIPEIEELIPKYIIGGEEMMVTENLGALGYKMVDKKYGLDLEHSELVMKALGKLHAATFNLRITTGISDFDNQIFSGLKSIRLNDSVFLNLVQRNVLQSLQTLRLAHDPHLEPAILILEHLTKAEDLVKTMLDLKDSKNLKVLCHGDFWIQNMLFRYNGDSVDSVKLLDFQEMALGSPAVDLWTFFYAAISPELLNTYYDHLVSIYSSSFTKMLKSLKMSTSMIPKIEDIKKEIDSKEMYGFLVTLMNISVICTNLNDIPNELDTFMGERDGISNDELPTNLVIVKRFSDITTRCIARDVFSNFRVKLQKVNI